MVKTVILYGDNSHLEFNASFFRCEIPATALRSKGHHVVLDSLTQVESYLDYDIFLFERNLFGPFLPLIKRLKKQGKKVYATWDDNYHLMPKNLPAYPVWHGQNSYLKELEEALGIIDAGFVPSQALKDYYSKFGNTQLVENFYPDAWLDIPKTEPLYELGWSGNATHIQSWENSNLIPALRDSKRSLLVNSSDGGVLGKLYGLYSAQVPWTKHSKYFSIVDKFSVGLAPLAGEYDRYRSNIKVLLYAARGKPWIASDLEPYRDAKGGMVVGNTKDEWVTAINHVFNDYERFSNMAREWAFSYRMSANLDKYEQYLC